MTNRKCFYLIRVLFWDMRNNAIYIWQCSRMTRVSGLNSLKRRMISVRLNLLFFSLTFTIDWISKLYLENYIENKIVIRKPIINTTNLIQTMRCFYCLLRLFDVCRLSAAFMNCVEPEKSVTIIEYLYHSYRANKCIMACAWWYKVGANWISFFLGLFFQKMNKKWPRLISMQKIAWLSRKTTIFTVP